MVNRAKIACTLDPELLASVEKLCERTGESRSAVVNRALALLLASQVRADRVKRYIEAHRERPEEEADVSAARRQARQTLSRLPWDDA